MKHLFQPFVVAVAVMMTSCTTAGDWLPVQFRTYIPVAEDGIRTEPTKAEIADSQNRKATIEVPYTPIKEITRHYGTYQVSVIRIPTRNAREDIYVFKDVYVMFPEGYVPDGKPVKVVTYAQELLNIKLAMAFRMSDTPPTRLKGQPDNYIKSAQAWIKSQIEAEQNDGKILTLY